MFGGSNMLAGKLALVTGGTSGIGLGIAKRLKSLGAQVVINSHEDGVDVVSVLDDVNQHDGPDMVFAQADMSDHVEVDKLYDGIEASFGDVNILVNNVGMQHVAPVAAFPTDKWRKILDINLSSAFYLTKRALPAMQEKRWGRVINVASAHGLVASTYKSAYVAAKHGMLGLTKVTALEHAQHGITCNAICPGYVWTPLVEQQLADQCKVHGLSEKEVIENIMLQPQPTKKFVQIDEVAELAGFLCCDLACSITGASLAIDGGWTAR
ncbi:3-hydroxybutyrate dehydrogenase [Maritalea sp.]|jgi:3-hydroxybutyrate dehydrogenase|uniref:3-hydroxybutyrate dehydrogenase n=1 Tax=Maritalea sp. TaxID=2003361 RepID=UPI0039E3F208